MNFLSGNETRSNWERLSGCSSEDEGWLCGYTLVEELWGDIEPLYSRLVKFVHARLKLVYRLDESEELLPVEFLGSLSAGQDGWLGAAAAIVPHRRLLDELKAGLNEMGDPTKLQLSAQNLIRSVGLGPHNGRHLTKIIPSCLRCFSASGELLSYCEDGLSELLVPNNTVEIDTSAWLHSHELAMHAALMKTLFDGSLAAYDLALESHPLTEALIQLAPSLAIQRLALAGGLIPDEVLQDDNAEGSALLLSALRILPKLAYYRMADKFRMQHLETNEEDKRLPELWWEAKRQNIRVTTTNLTWDMLTDKRMVKNRPHLASFLGAVLHYELLERRDEVGMQTILRKVARNSSWPAAKWQNTLKEHLGIERIVAEPLLEYFKPLYDYMDQTETIKQVTVAVIPRTTTTTSTEMPTTEIITGNKTIPIKQVVNHPEITVRAITTTMHPIKEEETSHESHSHTAAIAGALMGLFALLIVVGLLGRRSCTNSRRQRRPKPSSSANSR